MPLPAPMSPTHRSRRGRWASNRLAPGHLVAVVSLLVIVSAAPSDELVAPSHGPPDGAGAAGSGVFTALDLRPALDLRRELQHGARPDLHPGPDLRPGPEPHSGPDPLADLELHRLEDPHRTVVRDLDGVWVATFTDGARTVTLAGPERRFDEAAAADAVTSTTWVRLLDAPYRGEVDAAWLALARVDTSPDVLEVAAEYLPGSPEVRTGDGTLVSGNATYGPLDEHGDRPVGADWNDYQQATATYGQGRDRHVRRPTRARAGAMDCSGFVRMVFGIRHPVPLTSKVDGGGSLPRISRLQAREAPGVVPVRDRGPRPAGAAELDAVRPGDLVFFDAGRRRRGIDHVGIYLGTDEAGGHRFISSRRSSNGPTMGDRLEASLLDGDGLFARTFVATRRL